ncbi:phage portal protein [Phenylobacterium sp.]|uniref:phage portal protein n=1 Tax=Phenylobacterium sp. TaxID=1871053 RepID=UPI0025F44FD8|nr:phage portal protein [Phenylobacterium sp.]
MGIMQRLGLRTEQRSIENPAVPVSAENFLQYFGIASTGLASVTTDSALTVPAVTAAVGFLSRTLAALPLHAFTNTRKGPVKATGKLQTVIHENPNERQDSFKFRQYFWQQVFTGGRGLAYIERVGGVVEAIYPMDPTRVTIRNVGRDVVYKFGGTDYASDEIIDVPFMLRPNGLQHYGPIMLASKAIQLSIAMNDYASGFFAGGGVPPLVLVGPMPANAEAMKRAMADVSLSVSAAKNASTPIFPIPVGYELKPVGFDPAKGQMTEARTFQIQEIARAFQIPPVFLQDLTGATFSNVEQQDLHLVKHLIGQWAAALEGEMNLKLFGRMNGGKYVEHNLDGLLRGDFLTRMNGLARSVQSGILTPNEARGLENRPQHLDPAADQLFMQGATMPIDALGAAQPANSGGPNGA